MKRQTKTSKIIAHFKANPKAKSREVATKFKASMPTVYLARKEALSDWKVVATATSNTPIKEAVAAKPNPRANEQQYGGDHYINMGVQPWKAMEAWMTPEAFAGFLRGNAIKYLARADKKGGVEDLKKARHYLDKLIEVKGDNA